MLSGGQEVQEVPATLDDKADIYWTDTVTGRFCSMRVMRGLPLGTTAPPEVEIPDL